MFRWLIDLVGVFLGTALLQWLVKKLPRALVDNAMTGYIDNKIGAVFGITEGSVDAFLSEWIVPVFLAVAAVWLWHRWAARQLKKTPSLEENKGEFSEIMEAIWWIAERSAWGHWQDAQMAGRAEIHKLHSAEHMLRASAQNAEIIISGRIGGTATYVPIDQHFWRLVFFDIQPDPRSLWRAEVKPRDGIQTAIPNYDSLIVKRADLESLPWVGGIRLRFETLKLSVLSKFRKSFRRTMSWLQPSHIIIFGLAIALCGVIWQMSKPALPVVATHIQLGPEPVKQSPEPAKQPQSSGNPLIDAVNSFLAKSGKTTNWDVRNSNPAVSLQDNSDGLGPYISRWDVSLGPWPTVSDGFTANQLRRLPPKVPNLRLQSQKETLSAATEDFSKIINRKIGGMTARSDNVAGVHPIIGANRDRGAIEPLEKLQKLRAEYNEIHNVLFARGSEGNGTFFENYSSIYSELLRGLMPDNWQPVWEAYNVALLNLTRSVELLQTAEKQAENRSLYEQATANIEPYQSAFVQANAALRGWADQASKRAEMMAKAL
jgi:hypothetical protein